MEAMTGNTVVKRASSLMFANDRIDMGKKQKGYCCNLNLPDGVPKRMSQAGVVNPKLNSFNFNGASGLIVE
jgi:hypothetical protein